MKLSILLMMLLFTQKGFAVEEWRCYGWKATLSGKKFEFTDITHGKKYGEWEFDNELQQLLSDPACYKIKGKSYLVAKLSSGHKSRKVVVLDPLNKTNVLVFEKTSLDDISYEIKNNALKVYFIKEASVDDSNPVDAQMEWAAEPN